MTLPNLFDCTALNARLSETACLNNRDRWETERHEPLRPCGTCAAGQELAARNEVVDLWERAVKHAEEALASGEAVIGPCLDDDTPERRRILYPETELPWNPSGERTCKRTGCGEWEYGKSELCFDHLRRSIGEPYHYAPVLN